MKILETIFIASLCFTLGFTYEDEYTTVGNSATDSYEETTTAFVTSSVEIITPKSIDSTIKTDADSTPVYGHTTAVTKTGGVSKMTATNSTSVNGHTTAVTETGGIATMTATNSTPVDEHTTAVTETGGVATMTTTKSTSVNGHTTAVTETGGVATMTATNSTPVDEHTTAVTETGGVAKMTATNSTSVNGHTTAVTESLSVEVTTMAVPMPPSIIIGPRESVFYQSGENVTLDCKGKGVPDVTYEWRKNGIKLNQTLQNVQRVPDGTITIPNASSMDEGFYQCFAWNEYGTVLSKKAHLQRAFLDSTTRNTTDVLNKTVQEGEPLHIQCDPPSSFPKPTYGWEMVNDTGDKTAIPLQPSKRIQIAENGDLYFAYALSEDDLGGRIYRCTTNNSYVGVEAKGGYTQLTVTRNPAGNISEFAPKYAFSSIPPTPAGISTFICFFYGL